MTGHMLGAAGAAEALACVLALQEDIVPPTINLMSPDPELDLNYTPNQASTPSLRPRFPPRSALADTTPVLHSRR